MISSPTVVDFRRYRPAAVAVIDLVKHSTKERTVAAKARTILEHVLASNVHALALEDVVFNFTGDGYVCAFLGDASSRVIDFLNCAIPELRAALQPLDQAFRCGVDFGFVHLAENSLTRSSEHFDVPGIVATRLEQAAGANEILASELATTLFAPLYPKVFSDDARVVRVKDHTITCYVLTPLDFGSIRALIRSTLFEPIKQTASINEISPILLVEDDAVTSTLIEDQLRTAYPAAEIVSLADGGEALAAIESRPFAVVILDVNLPTRNGLDVAETALRDRPDTLFILESGVASQEIEFRSYEVGVALFLRKPIRRGELHLAIERCRRGLSPARLRGPLMLLSSDVGPISSCMWRITTSYMRMTSRSEADAATSLLRHKAKSVADDLIAQIQPGAHLRNVLEICESQLSSLNRLCDLMERAHADDVNVTAYLKSVAQDYATMYPKIEVVVQGSGTESVVIEHMTLFTLAVCELIDNAVAAVKPGGKIEVAIAPLSAVGLLHARVRDSGPGVPELVRKRLFQAGTSTKGSGRGLGLSLVRDAVVELGGSVSYEYESGAVFTIKVPLQKAAAAVTA